MTESLRHPIQDGVSSLNIRSPVLSNKPAIPLVKTNSFTEPQPLLSRQQTWLHAPSHDQTTGNILVRRRDKTCSKDKLDMARKDIMDVSDPWLIKREDKLENSGLEQRIQNNRLTRHQDAELVKKTSLDKIDNETQTDVKEACEELKRKMTAINDGIITMLNEWSKSKILVTATRDDIEKIQYNIVKGSHEKSSILLEFEGITNSIETTRINKISAVFNSYSTKLHSICYMLPNDIDRMVEDEIININMATIANRKQYLLLIESLIKGDHLLQREAIEKWDKLFLSWSKTHCQLQVEMFSDYMSCNDVIQPEMVNQLTEKLQMEQESVVRMRSELLSEISTVKPCNHNKAVISEWKERYHRTTQTLEKIHSDFLSKWQSCQESIFDQCERKIDEIKTYLISSGILESSKTFEFLTEKCIPLIEGHQLQVTEKLRQLQFSLNSVSSTSHNLFLSLFQYMQGAIHILDSHLAERDINNRERHTYLSSVRKEHDLQNQSIEANLDIVLDRLRQCASNEELDEYNRIAQELLLTIKEGYVTFHDQMSPIVITYPLKTKEELQNYDKKLCEYFGVDRNPPHKKKPRGKQDGGRSTGKTSSTAKKQTTQNPLATPTQSSTPTSATPTFTDMRALINGVLSTSNGTSFYVYTKANSENTTHENESNIFMTQNEETEDISVLPIVTKCLIIENEKFTEAKRSFCVNFLGHMENMKRNVLKQTKDTVIGRIEELRTELELRLHLHKPRPLRVKQDIHDVRKVELVAHQERLLQHSKAISNTLQQQKDTLQILPEKMEKQYQEISNELAKFGKKLDSAKSSRSLEQIHDDAKESNKMSIGSMEKMLANTRNVFIEQLKNLLSANCQYMSSLRLFSDGGNYCKQEVEAFSAKLEKQVERINKAERTIINGLELIQSSIAKRNNEIYITTFGVLYQHHWSDVGLIEIISSKLSHCQLLIKTEVLFSNHQSEEVLKSISHLKDIVSKDEMKVSDFVQMFPSIIKPLHDRVEYLYCKSKPHSGSRVGGQNEDIIIGTSPISAINLSKSILKYASNTTDEGASKYVTMDTAKQGKKSVTKKHVHVYVERRNVNYGISGGKDGTESFLPKIRTILRHTHNDLYSLIEDYYRLKGNKSITRPDEIQDNFEQMMDIQIDKLQSYRAQTEDYRNNCISEVHQQINSLNDALIMVIKYFYNQLSVNSNQTRTDSIDQLIAQYTTSKKHLDETKYCHDKRLRPCLGHPNRVAELKKLCSDEKERFQQTMNVISENRKKAKNVFYCESRSFVTLLVDTTCDILKALDSYCLSCQDIVPPVQKPLPHNELLRSIVHQKPITDAGSDKSVPDQSDDGGMWPGLKCLTLAFNSKDVERKMQITIKQSRVTPVHYMVIKTRDIAAEIHQELCVKSLKACEQMFEEENVKEEKLYQTWEQSVLTVKKLYDT